MTTSRFHDAVPKDPIQNLMDHLLTAPQCAWLDVIRRVDPHKHYHLIVWMLTQPECDGTVAQVAFYKAGAETQLRRRLSIVPDDPGRDAIPAIIAQAHINGRFTTCGIGLERGELDTEMDNMARLLAEISADDRVFRVPLSFLISPRAKPVPLEAIWSPHYDAETAQLYRAAGLLLSSRTTDLECRAIESQQAAKQAGLLSRLTARVRRQPVKSLE